MTVDTPVYIASVTKLYTATVVLLLQERGALSIDDPMSKYLPPALIRGTQHYGRAEQSDRVTLRQLLAHRSGIADYYEEKAADGKTLLDLPIDDPRHPWTVEELVARARSMPSHFPPGAQTRYSDTNYQLLGRIVEAVTGRPLQKVFDDLLFAPLHLTHTPGAIRCSGSERCISISRCHWQQPAACAAFGATPAPRRRFSTTPTISTSTWQGPWIRPIRGWHPSC
jgi:CubicO group peptidase (beta-lactamase class C family)